MERALSYQRRTAGICGLNGAADPDHLHSAREL